ncbi:hypothetical protein CLAFUR0_07415 [Fulvia fulva]|nr:hypothetical protein CLAFUR0_07415 [Fulvia fulva]
MPTTPLDLPDYEVVPGTVYLIEGSHQAGGVQDIILLPPPSSDLKDPLRWSRWRKAYHLFLLVTYSSVLGALTNWESPIYIDLGQHYQTKVDNLNIGSAITILMLGVGNVVFVPLSNKLGRRTIYIWTLLLVLLSQIWLGLSTTIGDFQGAHVLLGIGAAPFEALVAISISDVWFAHERGSKLGAYVFGLAFGSFVGPICAGYMSTSQGFRWIYWWGAILTGMLWGLFSFTFVESRFVRVGGTVRSGVVVVRKDAGLSSPLPVYGDDKTAQLQQEINLSPRAGEVLESDHWSFQASLFKTYPDPWPQIISEFWRPLKVSILPAVFWCGLNYGTCVSWLAVMATTIAEVFAPPPYSFTNNNLGLIWIAPMIGSLIGAYFSGPLNDRFTLYLSNRNHGWSEPEFRLWAFIPSAIIMPAGLILYGVTSAHGMHWIVPIVGTGFVGFGLSVGGTVSMSYIIDCYKEIDTHAITTIILIRNLVGFAITWAIQPWINGMGQQNAFILVGVLSFVITGFAGVFIVFGKAWRRAMSELCARLAAEAPAASM